MMRVEIVNGGNVNIYMPDKYTGKTVFVQLSPEDALVIASRISARVAYQFSIEQIKLKRNG